MIYDPIDDFTKSIEVCYEELRKQPRETWPAVLGKRMYYTITDLDLDRDGKKGVVVRAELETLADFNELLKKLLDKRDSVFPYPQKGELK